VGSVRTALEAAQAFAAEALCAGAAVKAAPGAPCPTAGEAESASGPGARWGGGAGAAARWGGGVGAGARGGRPPPPPPRTWSAAACMLARPASRLLGFLSLLSARCNP